MHKPWLVLFLLFLGLAPAQAVVPSLRMYDANITVDPSTTVVTTTVLLTAPRTIQLPSASATLLGQSGAGTYYQYGLEIIDTVGTLSAATPVTIQAQPGETIDGQSSITLTLPFTDLRLIPTNGSTWITDNRVIQAPSSAGLNIPSLLNPSYGADPNGRLDSAPAFSAACNSNPGASIRVPPGVYLWNSPQTFTNNCSFVGDGWNLRDPAAGPAGQALRQGSWILINNPNIVPITWNAAGTGGFYNIGWEQAQPTPSNTPNTPWAPTPYPPLITLLSYGEFHFERNFLYGVTAGVSAPATSGPVGGVVLDHLRGQVYNYAYQSDQNIDLTHADDVTLYPHALQNPNVQDYTQKNAIAFDLKRNDGFESDHMFALGMRSMFRFQQGTGTPYSGGPSNIHIGSLYCDACFRGFENYANNASIHITHLTFGGSDDGSAAALFAKNPNNSGLGPTIPNSVAAYDNGQSSVVTIDRIDNVISGAGVVNLVNSFGNSTYTIGATYIGNINRDNNNSAAFLISGNSVPSSIQLAYPPYILAPNSNNAPAGAIINSPLSYITNVWLPWKPTVLGTTTAGSPTYTTQIGEYLVSGGMVTVNGNLNVSSFGGAAGTIIIGGLPLNTPVSMITSSGSISNLAGFLLDTGYTSVGIAIPPAANALQMLELSPGTGTKLLSSSNFPGGMILNFSGSFRLQ